MHHWRLTLADFIQNDLGYKQSSLDPCTCLFCDKSGTDSEEELRGVMLHLFEVDDMPVFGAGKHEGKIRRLHKKVTCGKMKEN